MSKRNGSIHRNVLKKSNPDYIALSSAVEEKFKLLCTMYYNMRGTQILIPGHLMKDMLNWRTMVVRHQKGDFRHTDIEIKSLKNVAEWTLETHAKLRNQPVPKMEWRDYD